MTYPTVDFMGRKVLVVESEFLLPFSLYRAMERLGAEIIGPVGFPEDVQMLVDGTHPDAAIIDIGCKGEVRDTVLRVLRKMHVPFVSACRSTACVSGHGGCFRLTEAEGDLRTLGRALFA